MADLSKGLVDKAIRAISKVGFLRFALKRFCKMAEKNKGLVVDAIVARVNISTDERERAALTYLADRGLETFRSVLEGDKTLDWLGSKQACAIGVLNLVHDNIDTWLGDDVDIPGVPEWLEQYGADAIQTFIREVALPWASTEEPPAILG